MNKSEIYHMLEQEFTSTFIHELLPGILHNFANPLNGIMGRSKLLQRRIDDTVRKITEQHPDVAENMQDEFQKIKNDIRSINKESESFFDMFRDASGKFYSLVAKGNERINLSHLLAAEIRFSDFYLEFKHEINKHMEIDYEIPDFQGNIAEFSLAFWRLIRFAMIKALKSTEKDFYLKTEHNNEKIIVSICYTGDKLSFEENQLFAKKTPSSKENNETLPVNESVLFALIILKQYPIEVEFFEKEKKNVIQVTLLYRKVQN